MPPGCPPADDHRAVNTCFEHRVGPLPPVHISATPTMAGLDLYAIGGAQQRLYCLPLEFGQPQRMDQGEGAIEHLLLPVMCSWIIWRASVTAAADAWRQSMPWCQQQSWIRVRGTTWRARRSGQGTGAAMQSRAISGLIRAA
jgi:hypothetical protein